MPGGVPETTSSRAFKLKLSHDGCDPLKLTEYCGTPFVGTMGAVWLAHSPPGKVGEFAERDLRSVLDQELRPRYKSRIVLIPRIKCTVVPGRWSSLTPGLPGRSRSSHHSCSGC